MGILCHPWCLTDVFPLGVSVMSCLFPSVPPLPPKPRCWSRLILSCSDAALEGFGVVSELPCECCILASESPGKEGGKSAL